MICMCIYTHIYEQFNIYVLNIYKQLKTCNVYKIAYNVIEEDRGEEINVSSENF